MDDEDRWNFITSLDDELLKGGVILSEWCSFIVRETDIAFVAHAHLATIITAVAAIETHLRAEFAEEQRIGLYTLLAQSPLDETLKNEIQALRKYRNRWVHVPDPGDDQDILNRPDDYEQELEAMAKTAVRVLRQTIYSKQWCVRTF